MSLTLGEKLRQAREERGISISEVAEQTRISPHYLDLIEQDDYRTLPGGIFNKGFVKSYAKYVGLDEHEALQDYSNLIIQQEGSVDDDPKTYRPEVLTDDRTTSSMIPTIIFAVIILGLMTWGLLSLVWYIQDNQNQPVNPANTAVNSNSSNTNQAASNVAQPQPPPVTDKINVELKAVGEDVWTTYSIDGNKKVFTVKPDSPVRETAQNSFSLMYSKDKTPNLQLTINGKQISLPSAAGVKRNTIEFEITKAKLGEILQTGQITINPVGTAPTTRQR